MMQNLRNLFVSFFKIYPVVLFLFFLNFPAFWYPIFLYLLYPIMLAKCHNLSISSHILNLYCWFYAPLFLLRTNITCSFIWMNWFYIKSRSCTGFCMVLCNCSAICLRNGASPNKSLLLTKNMVYVTVTIYTIYTWHILEWTFSTFACKTPKDTIDNIQ